MHPSILSRSIQRPLRASLLLAFLLLVGLAGLRPAPAYAACGSPTVVSTEAQLNDAITAFNNATGPCDFEIQLGADITLTDNLVTIENGAANVSLLIDGAGFTVDGDYESAGFFVLVSDVTFEDITITGSYSAGIDVEEGQLRVMRSTIKVNNSDAIEAYESDVVVIDSALVSNFDSGIDYYGDSSTLLVINTTIADNNYHGAYIGSAAAAQFTHVTLYNNWSGLYVNSGNVVIDNSIMANNGEEDCATSTSLDINFSLVESNSPYNPCSVTDGVDGNIVGEAALLAPLGDYGGPTVTRPPLIVSGSVIATSPALDAGSNALSVDETLAALTTDQRGAGFPRQLNGVVDMGAVEGAEAVTCATSMTVSSESELNTAISCFNMATTAGLYTITFDADITLTSDITPINNPTAGVSLRIDGDGFTLDGDTQHDTILIFDTSTVTLYDITIINSSDDAIDSFQSDVRVERSTILGSDSDAVEFSNGDLVVLDSTLMNNLGNAIDANGDFDPTTVTIINTTITGNGLDDSGAVLLFEVTALLTHVTVVGNSDGVVVDLSDVTINNSILAGNDQDCIFFSNTVDVNFSLVQNDSEFDPCGVSDGVDGNIVGENPKVLPLGDYGGPTLTMPPYTLSGGVSATSPVVNAGSNPLSDDEEGDPLTTDQRGAGFPRLVGPAVDMGAVEGTEAIVCPAFPIAVGDEDALNEAIICYGGISTPGVYTISLDDDINLTASTFPIHNPTGGVSLYLDGNGRTIDGQDTPGVRPLTVTPLTTVTLDGATITGGNVSDSGGGLLNQGNLTLHQVFIIENTAENDGGGIFNEDDATLTIADSVINSNRAVFPDGDGGGIANDGIMSITDSAVSANTVNGDFGVGGGGILNEGILSIVRSSVATNNVNGEEEVRGGAISNYANLLIRDSNITGNGVTAAFGAFGAGIFSVADYEEVVEEGYGARLMIINSTIGSNVALATDDVAYGGGLYAGDLECCDPLVDPVPVTLINTTVADNVVNSNSELGGGGAYFRVYDSGTGLDVSIHNSVLADNSNGDCMTLDAPELQFESLHSFYEDSGDDACGLAAANPDADGNIVGEEPKLGPLANNGGPTLTFMPDADSPIINAGDNALADDENGDPLTADQRGFVPRIVNGTVDMGSVEVGAEGPAGSGIYMSATVAGTTDDGVAFGFEDILQNVDGDWSLFFDGSAAGLMPKGTAKHNINAFYVDPGNMGVWGDGIAMSFTQNARIVPGIGPKVDGMDVVWWDGSAFSLLFDGNDVGLTNKTQEKIDGLHMLDGSDSPIGGGGCTLYLLISTQGPGKVTNHTGGTLSFGGEDVLGFCAFNVGEATTGIWHMVLDGSQQGMPKNSTDSISLSADGRTLYLTTKGTFNVDAATGGHSAVYAYDMNTTQFSGPHFIAAAEGLPKKVDGLQVEGDLP